MITNKLASLDPPIVGRLMIEFSSCSKIAALRCVSGTTMSLSAFEELSVLRRCALYWDMEQGWFDHLPAF